MFGLAVLILLFGPVSGAHFNPVVSAADWLLGRRAGTGISAGYVASYTVAQITGGVVGAVLANVMFDRRVFEIATKDRITTGHLVGEVVATAGLIAVIFALAAHRAGSTVCRSGRRVHRRGLLVHQQHVVRQPRRHRRSDVLRHLRRDCARLCARFYRRPDHRSSPRTGADRRPLPGCRRHRRRCRRPAPAPRPSHRTTEFDMTDSPVPLAAHPHPDLSIDSQLALRNAASRLHAEFGEHFGDETIERFLNSAVRPIRRVGQPFPTSSRCWPNAGHTNC